MTIKEAREFAGLTQKQVAEMTGIPIRTQQNWENCVRIPPDYVEDYLIRFLKQEKMQFKVERSADAVRTYTLGMSGKFELVGTYPLDDMGNISGSIMYEIARAYDAGCKLIFV